MGAIGMAEPSRVFSYALSWAKRRNRNVKKRPVATAEWLEIDFLKRQLPEGLSKALRDAEREAVAPLIFRIRTKQCVRNTGAIPIKRTDPWIHKAWTCRDEARA